jgi:aerobic carbon-monoxide dehydrogenase small subunit
MPNEVDLQFALNGRPVRGTVEARLVLADFLREAEAMSGTKISCDQGACGACTVLLDGVPVASCSTFAFEANGKAVTTIESRDEQDMTLRVLREEFAAAGALQCGFCTAGVIMLAKSALDSETRLEREEIRRLLAGNWCRCTGYEVIIDAIQLAARRLRLARGKQ